MPHSRRLRPRLFRARGVPSRACFLARGTPRAPRLKAPLKAPGPAPLVDHGKWLAGVLCVTTASLAAADDLRPLYVEINEGTGHRYSVRIKTPPRVMADNVPQIVFPETCGTSTSARAPTPINCAGALYDAELSIRYPRREVANSTIVRMNLVAGESHTIALSSGIRKFSMPGPEDVATVAAQYAWLGAEHIWIGFDHLLFLVCLIWIAGTWKRIVITITGFTLAHSVTLALSALKIVRLPVPPIEAVIALSVLFLASEVTRGPRRKLTWRYPIAVSSSFGLLHGLGFAAALNEIGLPQVEVITGLTFFNVGVEIGQVIFALAVILLLRGTPRLAGGLALQRGRVLAGYAVGCVAAYWLIDQVVAYA